MRFAVAISASLLLLAGACTNSDPDGGATQPPSTTPADQGATESPTEHPTEDPTPTPVEPLTFTVADYIEDLGWGGLAQREGWKRVGIVLDMEYAGGHPTDALCMTGAFDRKLGIVSHRPSRPGRLTGTYADIQNIVSFALQTPMQAEYELNLENEGWINDCMEMVPGFTARLFLTGQAPVILETLAGSAVVAYLEPSPTIGGDTEILAIAPLQLGAEYATTLGEGARRFGDRITTEWGSWSITAICKDPSDGRVWITIGISNESPQDIRSWQSLGSSWGITLIDARGYPSLPEYENNVVVPPGFTKEWQQGITDSRGPEDSSPDLSSVLVIVNPGAYVFRGTGC